MTDEAARQNITELNYLGMRMAFPGDYSTRSLRKAARRCCARKFAFEAQWHHGNVPPLQIKGRGCLEQAMAKGRGVIVALPHVGPYHRVPADLVAAGIPVVMLIDSPNYAKEVAAYSQWAASYGGNHPDPMRYVNAQTPLAAWQMQCALKEQRALCLWLDGNTGLKTANEKTTVPVAFCNRTLHVRKGAAYLSARLGAPLVPAAARQTRTGKHVVEFQPALNRAHDESPDDFCQRAMQTLYTSLEAFVRKDPACWEEWYHLHLWCEPETNTAPTFALPDDPNTLLSLKLRSVNTQAVHLPLAEGRVLAHLRTGKALAYTPLVRAVWLMLHSPATLQTVLERLNKRFAETDVLEALLSLIASGFLVAEKEPA